MLTLTLQHKTTDIIAPQTAANSLPSIPTAMGGLKRHILRFLADGFPGTRFAENLLALAKTESPSLMEAIVLGVYDEIVGRLVSIAPAITSWLSTMVRNWKRIAEFVMAAGLAVLGLAVVMLPPQVGFYQHLSPTMRTTVLYFLAGVTLLEAVLYAKIYLFPHKKS